MQKRNAKENKTMMNTTTNLLAECAIRKAGPVSHVSTQWLNEVAPDLKESSIIKYEDILHHYILPFFGDTELSDITNENLLCFVNELRTTGGVKKKGLEPSTVSEIVTTMNALRIYALRRDLPIHFDTKCVNIKHEKHSIRVFSVSEENLLIEYLRDNINPIHLGILLCLYTGIRVGELCALKWDAINLTDKTMRIGQTMQRIRVNGKEYKTEVKILEPKSASSFRKIPLPEVLIIQLNRYYTPKAYFLSGDIEKFVEPRSMQKRFNTILKRCDIRPANFHATRHTFATRCVELGFDIKSLSEILGHSSVNITLNKYVHPTMDQKKKNMNLLPETF